MSWRVLVVDDEPVAARTHAEYVQRMDGFEVVAVARTGAEALAVLSATTVDVVLPDVSLPDMSGLDILRRLRVQRQDVDVVAVTSARNLEIVREAVGLGVAAYVLKPFVFATLRDRVEQAVRYRAQVQRATDVASQSEVDALLASLRSRPPREGLPKGLSADVWEQATVFVRDAGAPVSAAELAAGTGVSRVTARRYLEHMEAQSLVQRGARRSTAGRPVIEYGWQGAPSA